MSINNIDCHENLTSNLLKQKDIQDYKCLSKDYRLLQKKINSAN
jgi:hypothetical protein